MDTARVAHPEVKGRGWPLLLLIPVLLSLPGCATVGPGSIARDHFAYEHAATGAWKREMLSNLVRLRYGDVPVFLDVSSIINSYSLETEVSLEAGLVNGAGLDAGTLGGVGRYSDRPTITYSPMRGDRFTRSLMSPIPPGVVLSFIQAGWPADAVLPLLVSTINGAHNRFGAGGRARGADPDFGKIASTLRRVQGAAGVGMRIERGKDQDVTVMVLARKEPEPALKEDLAALRSLLGVRPDAGEVRVVFGSAARSDDEVAIVTRSMLEILLDASSAIEVPDSHVEEGRVAKTPVFDSDGPGGYRPGIRVLSGAYEPRDAFVSVPYHDRWFWIEDRDYASKRAFSFLLILFSLTDTSPSRGGPVITIPAG